MDISALSIILAEREVSQSISNEIQLKPGNRLRGRILNIQKNGNLLMDFGNFRALARANFPVNQNETLHVKLLEDGPRLKFELVRSESKDPSRPNGIPRHFNTRAPQGLMHLENEISRVINASASLPETAKLPKDVAEALRKVSTYVSPLRLSGNKTDIIHQLKNLTENSGLFLEKKLEQSLLSPHIKSTEPLKHLIKFPAIREILSNDLKSVLGPIKAYFNSGPVGVQLPMDARNTIEALLAQIHVRQNSAVDSSFFPGSTKALTYDSLRLTQEQSNTLLRLHTLVLALSENIKVYKTTVGGTVDKELENLFLKISASARVIRETLFSHFERPAKMLEKEGALRPILLQKSSEQGQAMQQSTGAGTVGRATPALPVNPVLGDILRPMSAQQHPLFSPIRHLAELIAGLNNNQNIPGASNKSLVQEKAVKPAASPNFIQAMNHMERLSLLSKPEQQSIPRRLLSALFPGRDITKTFNPETPPKEPSGTSRNSFCLPPLLQQEQGHVSLQRSAKGTANLNTIAEIQDFSPAQERAAGMRAYPGPSKTMSQTGLSPAPIQPVQNLISLQQLIAQIDGAKINQEVLFLPDEEHPENETRELTSARKVGLSKEWVGFAGVTRFINAELMPALLKLEEIFNTKSSHATPANEEKKESLIRSVKNVLSNLKNFQGTDAQREPTPDQVQVFAYDFLIKENKQRARLKIFHPKKKKGEKEGFRASLLLSMKNIGDIKADFLLLKNNLNITFFVKDLSIKNMIEKDLAQITPQIHKSFEELTVKVKISENAVEQFDTEWNDIPSNRIIDLKI